MKRLYRLLLFSLISLLPVTAGLAETPTYIGKVSKVTPEAVILRGDQSIVANKNVEILPRDVLKTDASGSLGIIFRDGTILTLGPASEFRIQEYVFVPLEKKTSFIGTMRKGSLSYISGAIGRINPESVKVETPTAYLGLRGTKVLIRVD